MGFIRDLNRRGTGNQGAALVIVAGANGGVAMKVAEQFIGNEGSRWPRVIAGVVVLFVGVSGLLLLPKRTDKERDDAWREGRP